jgi:CRP-like cAMP-binding protein
MAIQTDFLKSTAYFPDLSPAGLNSIAKLFFEKKAERGEMFLLEGESDEVLYFVVSGVVKVLKTSVDGKEQILNIARPGDSFNDVAAFDGGPNPAAAQAMGPVMLYGIRRNNLETILRDYPKVAPNAIKVLSSQIRYLLSLVEDLSFKHVIGRIARILLEHAGDGKGTGQRLTQQDMAAMASTVREVVGRSLKSMEQAGAIRFDRSRLVITNKEILKRIMETP